MLSDLHVKALLAATRSQLILKRVWLLEAMTVVNEHDTEIEYKDAPVKVGSVVAIEQIQVGTEAFIKGQVVGLNKQFTGIVLDDANGQFTIAVLTTNDKPVFHRLDVFNLAQYDVEFREALGVNPFTASLRAAGKTTFGRFLENVICLQYPFNFRIFAYINKIWKPDDILGAVTNAMVAKTITVQEYKQFIEYMFYLNHITEICVPSMTTHSLMTNPKIPEIKAKFIAEHQGQMHDPIVIKELEDLLAKADAEWLGKGTDHEDPSVTFFDGLGSKSYDIHRKKLFLTTGGIPAFDEQTGQFDFISNSLMEGWTIEAIPSIANEIRKGSYERGRETAKGGAETKLVMRVFQDLAITSEDCGTKRTLEVDFKNTCRVKDFIGRWVQMPGGDVMITEQNMQQFDGKVAKVYSPMTCATPYDLCYKCCGQRAKDLGAKVIGIQVVKITSKFMLVAMKNMHGTVLKVVQPKLENIFI